MTRRPEERLRMRFSEMMGSGDDQSVSGDGDTVVETDVETVAETVVEAVVAEPAAAFEPVATFEPVVPFEPAATFEPVATFEPEPSEPIAAGFADFTPLSDDLLPRKR
jgi:hypothetical protein